MRTEEFWGACKKCGHYRIFYEGSENRGASVFLETAVETASVFLENMPCTLGPGEMAQWLKASATLAEDLGSVPSTRMMAPVP